MTTKEMIIKVAKDEFIAHRLKTVRDCDNIFVIDEGKIAQSGKHDDLMNKMESIRDLSWIEKTQLVGKSNNKKEETNNHLKRKFIPLFLLP